MRTFYRHKAYDTDRARLVGEYSEPTAEGGLVTERLYRMGSGEPFVHVSGGGSSRCVP